MSINIGDYRAQLTFKNAIVQSQGFATFVADLRSTKVAKDKASLLCLLWSCYDEFGRHVCQWAISIIPILVLDGVVDNDTAVAECLRRIEPFADLTVRFILRSTKHLMRTCTSIIQERPGMSQMVITQLNDLSLPPVELLSLSIVLSKLPKFPPDQSKRIIHSLKKLYPDVVRDVYDEKRLWDILREDTDVVKLKYFDSMSVSELSSCPLSLHTSFIVARLVISYPQLLHNQGFIAHPLFVPPLLQLCAIQGEFVKGKIPIGSPDILSAAKKHLLSSQQVVEREKEEWKDTLWSVLQWVEEDDQRVIDLICRWTAIARSTKDAIFDEESVCFLCGLFPKCIRLNCEGTMFLLVAMAENSPFLANTLFLLCLSLYAKPWLPVPRPVVLRTIGGVVTNRAVVPLVLKFLLAASQNSSDRLTVIGLLGEIVERWPTSIGEVLDASVKVDESKDDREWGRAKLMLLKRIILASDRSDDFLPYLSSMMRKYSQFLPDVIQILSELCRNGELKVRKISDQLRDRVYKKGQEEALAEYAHLIASSFQLPDEQEFAVLVVPELWRMLEHEDVSVKNASLVALSKCEWELLRTHLMSFEEKEGKDIIDILLDKIEKCGEGTEPGVTALLHHVLAVDVESLPRPLYTKVQKDSSDALLSVLPSVTSFPFHPTHALSFFSHLIFSHPPNRRNTFASNEFRLLLSKVKESELSSVEDRLSWLAGWRLATEELVILFEESRTDDTPEQAFSWARDNVCEELKKSLLTTSSSLPNVVASLTFLALFHCQKGDLSQFRPFLVSVVEFLCICASPTYKPKSPPIFQISLSSCSPCPAISSVCLSLIGHLSSSSDLVFFDFQIPSEASTVMEWVYSGLPSTDWLSILDGSPPSSPFSFCLLRIVATVFRVDPIDVELLEDHLVERKNDADIEGLWKNEGTNEVKKLLEKFIDLPRSNQETWKLRVKKRLEAFLKKANEEEKSWLFSRLSLHALSSRFFSTNRLPSSYDHLPKTSILRRVVERIQENGAVHAGWVPSLMDHIRSNDGRRLPPLDWSFLPSHSTINNIRMAAQARDKKMLTRLLTDSFLSSIDVHSARILSSILPSLLQSNLKLTTLRSLMKNLLKWEDKQILDDMNVCMDDKLVHDECVACLPEMDAANMRSPLLTLSFTDRGMDKKGLLFDVYLETKKGPKMNTRKLVDLLLRDNVSIFRNNLSLVVSWSPLSDSDRMDKLLELITLFKQERVRLNGDSLLTCASRVWECFVVLLCGFYSNVPLTFANLTLDGHEIRLFLKFFDMFIASSFFSSYATQVTSFIIDCYSILSTVREPMLILFIRRLFAFKEVFSMKDLFDCPVWGEIFSP